MPPDSIFGLMSHFTYEYDMAYPYAPWPVCMFGWVMSCECDMTRDMTHPFIHMPHDLCFASWRDLSLCDITHSYAPWPIVTNPTQSQMQHATWLSPIFSTTHLYAPWPIVTNPLPTTHEGIQTKNIWMSRSISSPDRSFEWRGLRLLNWKRVGNFGDSPENVFHMYRDSR